MKLLLAALLAVTAGVTFTAQDPMEMPKPGPEHAILQQFVGTWDAVIIMPGADGAEQRSKAKMVTRKHGEFHIVDDFTGEFMGMPFTGHGVTSYCPVRKKYFTTWTDSMAPSPLVLTGDWDAKTKMMSMKGECVGMSGKLEPCRTMIQHKDADHYAFEMHGLMPDGTEGRHLRIEYTRKK